jgi:predicted naringenin-chalcone synthase
VIQKDTIDSPYEAASTVRLRPTPMSLSSAYPPFEISQQESWESLFHGPKIVRLLGKLSALEPRELRASWDVLANVGNCASATVLLVLESILLLRVDEMNRATENTVSC